MMESNLDDYNSFYQLSKPHRSLVAREGEESQEDNSKIGSARDNLEAQM
jgi:hypothetical protein